MNPTTFHLSLNVSNLPRSVAFYRVLFGREPAKCHDDYAKFELTDPPVIFSLVPQPSLAGGSLSRIGFRLADADAVAEVKQRLEAAGFATQVPPGRPTNGTARCYVADPDLNYWEVSAGEEGLAVELPRPTAAAAPAAPVSGPVVWEHFITGPLPERISHEDESVDEVRLTGTFNAALPEGKVAALLGEVKRVLRPGGKVVVHGLVGDRPFTQQPKLPGLAAMVERVPVQTEPLKALSAAGFGGIQFVKFSEKAWFTIDGVELLEVKLIAAKVPHATGPVSQVMYRGPFADAIDDFGIVYPRGQRVTVSAAIAAELQGSAVADQFLFVPAGSPGGSCSTRG